MAGEFKLKKVTNLSELQNGGSIPESDLAIPSGNQLLQFDHIELDDKRQKVVIKPGKYTLAFVDGKIGIMPIEFQNKNLLDSATNTTIIMDEFKSFFDNLHEYDELEEKKKRAILLFSEPGLGKTSSITKCVNEMMKDDAGTVAILWPTSEISSDNVEDFFIYESEYSSECTRLVLIIEDIGGRAHEMSGGNTVDAGLLSLLDGVTVPFVKPTFIVATTNYPENLLKVLADRPGRFDELIKLKAPNGDERISLVEFIAKRPLTEEEKELFKSKDLDSFSIAHLKEVVVRSRLKKKTLSQVVSEILNHKKLFNKAFSEKNSSMGISLD